jgi:hypothetical protein
MKEKRNACTFIVRHLKRGRHLGDRRRWENNIKPDLKEIQYEGVDWTSSTQHRGQLFALVNTVLIVVVP